MRIHRFLFSLSSFAALALAQQQPPPTAERAISSNVIDDRALRILKSATDVLKDLQTFSFRAVIQREALAPTGQMMTFERRNDVAISRPGRMRINIAGQETKVEVYFSNGELFIYAPAEKEFVGLGTSSLNLDTMVDNLETAGIALPVAPLFRSDPYRNLVEGLEAATLLGSVQIDGKTMDHVGFRKPDVEWQLWVETGSKPLPRRAQAIYKTLPREPRMTIDFSDWNLSPDLPAEYYVFSPPPGAKAVPAINMDELK